MTKAYLLLPWLAVSTLSSILAADSAHDFTKWEPEIAAFERSDRTTPPPQNALLFIGSSTIRLWTSLQQDFPEQCVINRGFGGSEIADSTHFAERVIFPYHPRMIFLRAGGNDIHAGTSPEQVFSDFKEFVAKIHATLPQTDVVFISLCPSVARWEQAEKEKKLNTMVEEHARNMSRVKYIETYSMSLGPDGKPRPELFREDKLHFNAEGYKWLAARVRTFLNAQ
jgi:lysophospholipase L1-like esterase